MSLQIDTALLSFQTLVTSVKAYRLDVGLIPVTPTLKTAPIPSGASSVPADLGRMASCVHVSHSTASVRVARILSREVLK